MATVVSSIRIDKESKDWIERAARQEGVSYHEFIVIAATKRAAEVLDSNPPQVTNLDRILAVARDLDFPDDAPTAGSTIAKPFPGLI